MRTETVADEGKRINIRNLGEYYTDMLRIEAFIKDSAITTQAGSMLRAYLNKRTAYRDRVVEYLAWKRGISPDDMKMQIISGEAAQLSQEELIELRKKKDESNEDDTQN